MQIKYKDLTPEAARKGCFVYGMPDDHYHAYEGISKSGLDLISRSPAHYFLSGKQKAKRHFDIGKAVHCAILEPERFKQHYVLLRDTDTRQRSEYKQAIKAHDASLVLVSGEVANIESMMETVAADKDARHRIETCDSFELCAFVECPETGALLKCRFDAINLQLGYALDLKTTRDSSRKEFSKSVFNYRYHIQDAHYSRVFELITGRPLVFEFLAVENEPPHNPMIFRLDDEAKMIGLEQAKKDIQTYADCIKNNNWKGYEKTSEPLSLPAWALAMYDQQIEDEII